MSQGGASRALDTTAPSYPVSTFAVKHLQENVDKLAQELYRLQNHAQQVTQLDTHIRDLDFRAKSTVKEQILLFNQVLNFVAEAKKTTDNADILKAIRYLLDESHEAFFEVKEASNDTKSKLDLFKANVQKDLQKYNKKPIMLKWWHVALFGTAAVILIPVVVCAVTFLPIAGGAGVIAAGGFVVSSNLAVGASASLSVLLGAGVASASAGVFAHNRKAKECEKITEYLKEIECAVLELNDKYGTINRLIDEQMKTIARAKLSNDSLFISKKRNSTSIDVCIKKPIEYAIEGCGMVLECELAITCPPKPLELPSKVPGLIERLVDKVCVSRKLIHTKSKDV